MRSQIPSPAGCAWFHAHRWFEVAWKVGAMMLASTAVAQVAPDTRSTRPLDRALQIDAPSSASMQGALPVEAKGQRRVALVIGNGSYKSVRPLKNSHHDAHDMCAALGRLGFLTTCLFDLPNKMELRGALLKFGSQLEPGTVGLFYYAGHGVQVQGRNYLLPTALAVSTGAEVEEGSLALEEVFGVMRDGRASLNIVVLDACRDDPFAAGRGPKVARGLAREEPPTNSVLVYATAPGAVAADGNGRNGLFTSHLLSEVERPGPQIGELLRTVARAVEQEARSSYGLEQVPYRSFSYSGVFCFAQCDDTRIAEQVQALRRQSAAAVRRIQELEQLNARLEQGRTDDTDRAASRSEGPSRLAELRSLRDQLAELTAKAAQLETSRARIAELEREARERDQRFTESLKQDAQRRSRPMGVPTF